MVGIVEQQNRIEMTASYCKWLDVLVSTIMVKKYA